MIFDKSKQLGSSVRSFQTNNTWYTWELSYLVEPGDAIKHCKERIPDTRGTPFPIIFFAFTSVAQIAKTKHTLYESVQMMRDDTVVIIDDTMIRADDHNNDYGQMNLMMQWWDAVDDADDIHNDDMMIMIDGHEFDDRDAQRHCWSW